MIDEPMELREGERLTFEAPELYRGLEWNVEWVGTKGIKMSTQSQPCQLYSATWIELYHFASRVESFWDER